MQTIVLVFLAMVAVTLALPAPQNVIVASRTIPILQHSEVRDNVGQYALNYLSGDGTSVAEQGALTRNIEGTDNVLVKQGSFSYTSPEGIPITLTYVADHLGFRAEGEHLPRPVAPLQV